MTHETRVTILQSASIFIIAAGLAATLALFAPFTPVIVYFYDFIVLPMFDGQQSVSGSELLVSIAIIGGLTAGLGVFCLMVTNRVYRNDPNNGGAILVTAMMTWFCVDGFGSIVAGAWFNAFVNLGFLLPILIPVVWPTRGR